VLTATALYASVGDIHAFKSGRHLASWLGLTPREKSSGERRRLGRITKQGDPYLRTLLIHGARSALLGAERARRAGRTLTHLQAWALERAGEGHTNRAAVALANKLARIAWASGATSALRRRPRTPARRRLSQARRRTTQRRGSGERNRVDQEEEGPTRAARGESIAPHGRAVGPPPG
jgi:hypothetical protein